MNVFIKKLKNQTRTKVKMCKRWISTHRISIFLSLAVFLMLAMLFAPIPHYETAAQKVAYETSYKENAELDFGEQKTKQEGIVGESIVRYRSSRSIFDLLFRKDSIKKEVVSTTVVKAPVSKVVAYGSGKSKDEKPQPTTTPPQENTVSTADRCLKLHNKELSDDIENFQRDIEFMRKNLANVEVNAHLLTEKENNVYRNKYIKFYNDSRTRSIGVYRQNMTINGCSAYIKMPNPGYVEYY